MLVGSALGAAVRDMLGEVKTTGCFRFLVPLDEALTDLRLDFDGSEVAVALKPFGNFPPRGRERIGNFRTSLTEVILRSFAEALAVGLKVKKLRGDNAHHIVEAAFKSLARCLRRSMDAFLKLTLSWQPATARRVGKTRATKERNSTLAVS